MAPPQVELHPLRPNSRDGFEIAIICALTLEADAVEALFDCYWDDDGPPFDKAPGDPNAYTTGAIGRHNIVLAHMPGMGKISAAIVANNCRTSFPNIKLALVVGITGVVPFDPHGAELILGDVVISDGVIQYDLGRWLPGHFARKDTLLDSLGRPNIEIRALLGKLKGFRSRKLLANHMASHLGCLRSEPQLGAEYPGREEDKLFEATYQHIGDKEACEQAGCNGKIVLRSRLQAAGNPEPIIHFGLVASGDSVMKSGEDRDAIARADAVIAFEMEGAGIWDTFPCVVIKGACDYADSHKSKKWQRYAAATAAACMKSFLSNWVPGVHDLQKQQEGRTVKYIIPYTINRDFVGRSGVLEMLKERLSQEGSRVSLFGLGGVGKTQIALAYVYWLKGEYPLISIFWVHASSVERFRQAYASIAQEYRIPGYSDPKVDVLPLVKDWLTKPEHGQWLMVIDNADDLQIFSGQYSDAASSSTTGNNKENLTKYLPECSHGALLITTRNKKVGYRLTKGQPPIEVRRMSEEDSGHLLRARLRGISTTSAEISNLSARLEYLPLALSQSAAYIHETSITVNEYLQLMGQNDEHIVELLSKEFETVGRDSDTPHAVAETWILSFRQIEQKHALAAELLSLMSIFDRQNIPTQLLSCYCEEERRGDPLDNLEIVDALGILKAFCFVTEETRGGFNMHRLVQLVTRKWLTRGDKIRHPWGKALFTIWRIYPNDSFENWERNVALLPHANSILGSGEAVTRPEREARASLVYRMSAYFGWEGKWKKAEEFSIEATELRQELFGKDHPKTLRAVHILASAYENQGRWDEAEELQLQVLEKSKTSLGADHPDTLTAMDSLASIYRRQGRRDEAEELQLQVIEKRKTSLGADHPSTLAAIHNLASTYRKQGRWDKAEELLQQVLEKRKTSLGADHPDTLTTMHSLASIYQKQGRWDKAEELQLQVLEKSKASLGADHPDTLTTIHSLASTYRKQGRWDKAEELQLQVLEKSQTSLGADHPDTLTTMHSLASTYLKQGRWDEAEELQLQVLEKRKTSLGADHPDTLTATHNLASIYQKQGRWDKAEELQLQVLEKSKTSLGADHPDTLTSMHNLASIYQKQGRWDKAEELQLQVFEKSKTLLGADHPDTLTATHNLAFIYQKQGRWDKAEELQLQVLEKSRTSLRADHPDTLTAMQNLASTYRN